MGNTTYILSIILASIGYILFFMFPLNKGAPFIPNNIKKISTLIKILEDRYHLNNFKNAVDLGSGDGRIMISLAKKGVHCDGIEQNRFLFKLSTKKIAKRKIQNIGTVFNDDFLRKPLSKYDLVILWQAPQIMQKLSDKFKRELKSDTVVCSYYFALPGLKEDLSQNGWHIYKI